MKKILFIIGSLFFLLASFNKASDDCDLVLKKVVDELNNHPKLAEALKENPKLAYAWKKYSNDANFSAKKEILSEPFKNQLADDLADELSEAKRLGVTPTSLSDTSKFDEIIGKGPIKWVVKSDGELVVMPKFKDGVELKHPVLSNGESVLSAGEAELAGNVTEGYLMLEFNNHSGHFLPSNESSTLFGKEGFNDLLNILNDF